MGVEVIRKPSRRTVAFIVFVVIFLYGAYHVFKPLPYGLSYRGGVYPAPDVEFLADITYVNEKGVRVVEHEILDTALALIDGAERFILVDMFLYNDFMARGLEGVRPLAQTFTDHLIQKKMQYPEMNIVLIVDPINELFGGIRSPYLEAMRTAGVQVVTSDLVRLRDSNPLYSTFWRLFVRPFGVSEGGRIQSMFSDHTIGPGSFLQTFNFKANHRKVFIADQGDKLVGLVTSANVHDASSLHSNVGLVFSGLAVVDLLATEEAVIAYSGGEVPPKPVFKVDELVDEDHGFVQVATERKAKREVIKAIKRSQSGDRLDVAMFYLSARSIVRALKRAENRGVKVRVILDPNKDAFGRDKNGVPNRPVAYELYRRGVKVRWYRTTGEQFHTKMLLHTAVKGESTLILGSSNFTRRNLNSLNLETSVVLRGSSTHSEIIEAGQYFDRLWFNEGNQRYTVEYDVFADESKLMKYQYRFQERTGLSTF